MLSTALGGIRTLCLLVLGVRGSALATLIVDTGDPGQIQEGLTVDSFQWLAREITLGHD